MTTTRMMNNPDMKRRSVLVDESVALDTITDGMTIALGGFITTRHATGLRMRLMKIQVLTW